MKHKNFVCKSILKFSDFLFWANATRIPRDVYEEGNCNFANFVGERDQKVLDELLILENIEKYSYDKADKILKLLAKEFYAITPKSACLYNLDILLNWVDSLRSKFVPTLVVLNGALEVTPRLYDLKYNNFKDFDKLLCLERTAVSYSFPTIVYRSKCGIYPGEFWFNYEREVFRAARVKTNNHGIFVNLDENRIIKSTENIDSKNLAILDCFDDILGKHYNKSIYEQEG